MTFTWKPQRIPLKFLVGDRRLFSVELKLQTCSMGLMGIPPVNRLDLCELPTNNLDSSFAGFFIRRLPIAQEQPTLGWLPDFIWYVSSQDPRYYIDLTQSFELYQQKFSPKTRSTIRRKIRRFSDFCGGTVRWKVYKDLAGTNEFYPLARAVSNKTYQHRHLEAGLPSSEEFLSTMRELASDNGFRGYILFHFDRPIAYLYCPVYNGVLEYQHLGYDPEYREWSVGTILLWQALADIHNEGCFRMFDFAGGQTEQIRMFATDSARSANVYILRKNLRNTALVQAHRVISVFSFKSGRVLDRFGLKIKVRRVMRFGRLMTLFG